MNQQREIGRIDTDIRYLVSKYHISEDQAGCYLVNFKDEFICCKYNGGCKHIEQCQQIFDREMELE